MAGGAPVGNNNPGKNKMWKTALNERLKKYKPNKGSKVEHYWALQAIADKLIESALEGDMQAIKEIGDRVDGKAVQAIEGVEGGASIAISVIERHIVK